MADYLRGIGDILSIEGGKQMTPAERGQALSQIHRKLENDECFDYGCTHESRWKIIYTDPQDRALRVVALG